MKIVLNDSKELVKKIKKAVSDNDGYCPCKVQKNSDTKCICKEFRECDHAGPCQCGLYKKIME